MKTQSLNGQWELAFNDVRCNGTVPGSVYSFLLGAGLMQDPFYRENELTALPLMENDFVFSRVFTPCGDWRSSHKILLRCEGLDTLCALYVNGTLCGKADNMHRLWEFDVTSLLNDGENLLELKFESPVRYIREQYAKTPINGTTDAMVGFPLIRKAHCMFGWDWGPRLPDAGIWRDISLVYVNSSRITDVHIRQRHQNGCVELKADVTQTGDALLHIEVTSPDGIVFSLETGQWQPVENPALWWPNGYGAQPLYTVKARLEEQGVIVDEAVRRIGLRTMTVLREKDEWGESFAQCCNGVAFFAMGADYIPEDNILSRVTPERTRALLTQCAAVNMNSIRVWGGGYYPDDFFFDICDELGLVVWQDFMFSCAEYVLTDEFALNIRAEAHDNVRRIRHHASLGLWCGNNEMEMFQATGEYGGSYKERSDYIRMFEHILPEVVREDDPDTFYWPASPSSGGGFDFPNDPNRGDAHYWEVWHGLKPFTDYRKYFFRYASEFGFQSFPCLATVKSFALPEDFNIFSRVMERHQRNGQANGRILSYLAQTYLYPTSFDTLLYASQLLQAEAIRYGVEHWRRNRGRCMGAIYWQLNDCWPVVSWASIDYFNRWKALHYAAKRFFAPVLVSCEETGELTGRIAITAEPAPVECTARLCVANETVAEVSGVLRWALRDNTGKVLRECETQLSVPALSSLWAEKLDFPGIDCLTTYLSFEFVAEGVPVSRGTVLFTAPKHFRFLDPKLSYSIDVQKITVRADAYAKNVELYTESSDLLLSDNFFDMDAGERTVTILSGSPDGLMLRSVYDIR